MIGANQLQYIEEIHIQNDATKRPRWIEDEHFNEFKNRVFFSFQYNVKAFEFFLREESEIIYLQILECHKSHPLKKHETKQRTEE